MTGYQKLKLENENLKRRIKHLKNYLSTYGNALVEIGDLKGPNVTQAPSIAWKAIKEVFQDAEENDN